LNPNIEVCGPNTSAVHEDVLMEPALATKSDVADLVQLRDDAARWLAQVPRLPDPGEPPGLQVDLQSVYLIAEHRGRGLGTQLIEAALAHAVSLGASAVTVQAGRQSMPLYGRIGFARSERLLQMVLHTDR
jgi:GNAT superfamily N-acetyltransferase